MKVNLFSVSVSWHKLIVTLIALVLSAISFVQAGAWFTPVERENPPLLAAAVEAPKLLAVSSQSGKERVESEVITLLPTGFSPSEITRPQGRFLIVLDNRSGLDEVNLTLSRADGHRLRAAKRTKEQLIWRQIEDLPPGEYLLKEAGHPEWVCRITIKGY